MIDAHVQYNGGWKTYLTLQPGLACEFEDHRTCKEASERLQAVEDAKDQQIKDQEAEAARLAVEEASKTAEADAKQAEINAAGQKKHEAMRIVNKDAADNLAKYDAALAEVVGKIKAKAAADIEEVIKGVEKNKALVVENQKKAIAEIEATDWLSEVRKAKEPAPEPTPEVAPEPTPEVAPEPTPEVAPEPTPEVAPEPTPEVAPEPTPEVAPEA